MSADAQEIVPETRQVQPLYCRVLVKKLPPAEQTAGGLWLPDRARDKQKNFYAVVKYVGPGIRVDEDYFYETQVKPGDKVIVPEYDGHRVQNIDGEDLLCYDEQQIFAIMFDDDDPRAAGLDVF